jgi:hypothetical protein
MYIKNVFASKFPLNHGWWTAASWNTACMQLQQVHDNSEEVLAGIWSTIYAQCERRDSAVNAEWKLKERSRSAVRTQTIAN